MVDLSTEMAELAERLGPPPGAVARVVQFLAAESGEGTSTLARAFAREMAQRARRGVWLIELDLMRGEQHAAIAADPQTYGPLGRPATASPDGSMFFGVTPAFGEAPGERDADARYLAAYPVGGWRWWVTRFQRERLQPGQTARILASPSYWDALRPHADYVVVDAPAAERSPAAFAVAAAMDSTVLVVSGRNRNVKAATAVRDELAAAGGRCAGVVVNHAPAPAPAFLRRFGA